MPLKGEAKKPGSEDHYCFAPPLESSPLLSDPTLVSVRTPPGTPVPFAGTIPRTAIVRVLSKASTPPGAATT